MSQQQINRLSAEKYLNTAIETLNKQADLYYLEEHFKLDAKYDRQKFIHAQLYKDVLCTDDCEILNWVDRKIRGRLEGKIKLSKDNKLDLGIPDIIINNYYNTESNWDSIDW